MIAETLIIIFTMFVAVMGPSVTMAMVARAMIKALSRNPSAANKMFIAMCVVLFFVTAISIVAILVIFQLFSK